MPNSTAADFCPVLASSPGTSKGMYALFRDGLRKKKTGKRIG